MQLTSVKLVSVYDERKAKRKIASMFHLKATCDSIVKTGK